MLAVAKLMVPLPINQIHARLEDKTRLKMAIGSEICAGSHA